MLEKWFPSIVAFLRFLKSSGGPSAPLYSRVGPKWYLSTWWPSESLVSMQYSFLCLLAVAHAERLEIKPLVAAFADEHRGTYRRRLRLLARRMGSNATLLTALEKTPDALNDNTVLAIRFGSQSGTLAKTYEQLMEDARPRIRPALTSQGNSRGYWFIVGACIFLLFQSIMFFIAPTMKKISSEFEMQLPTPMRALYITNEFALVYFVPIALSVCALAWVFRSSSLRRFFRRQIGDRIFRDNSLTLSSQLFRMLAIAVEMGRPLPGALSTLAKYHFDKGTRQKLLIARNEVEQGIPPWNSLVEAKIITPNEYQALSGAANNRVQSWTLRKMATIKQETIQSHSDVRMTFVHPVVILVFAAILLWICYSFFSFITNLIQQLAR